MKKNILKKIVDEYEDDLIIKVLEDESIAWSATDEDNLLIIQPYGEYKFIVGVAKTNNEIAVVYSRTKTAYGNMKRTLNLSEAGEGVEYVKRLFNTRLKDAKKRHEKVTV